MSFLTQLPVLKDPYISLVIDEYDHYANTLLATRIHEFKEHMGSRRQQEAE
jgi:hypothetical protein